LDSVIQYAAVTRDTTKPEPRAASTKLETLRERIVELDQARDELRASMEVLRARLAAKTR
jgi:hypothetical protein